jgi:GAF domain-containing protein
MLFNRGISMNNLQTQPLNLDPILDNAVLSPDEKIQAMLDHGCATFGLNLGIVSRILSNYYFVEYVSPTDSGLEPGQMFRLPRTYCDITVRLKFTVGIANMGLSPHNSHPCYSDFSLETYFGTPIRVDDTIYGTLNFTAKDARPVEFTKDEKAQIEVLARAIGTLLAARKSVRAFVVPAPEASPS